LGQQLFLKQKCKRKMLRGLQMAKYSGASKWQKAQGPKRSKAEKSKGNGTRPS